MFTLFFLDDWSVIYRLVLCIFRNNQDAILYEDNEGDISNILKKNYSVAASVALDKGKKKLSEYFWFQQLS